MTVKAETPRAGVAGLGLVGSGVVHALARAGIPVTGYDVVPSATAALADVMAPAASLEALARECDVLLVAVMTDAQVREVLAGPGGILGAPARPRVVVILSTAPLDTIRWAAELGAGAGVSVLDCGVSGSPRALAASAMVAMIGGDGEAFAYAEPVLHAFADPVLHMGPLGRGMAAKLARNLIIYSGWLVAWEGARLAQAAGVDVSKLVEAVEASDRFVDPHMALVARGVGLAAPGEEGESAEILLEYALKDLGAALELGRELGLELPAATLAESLFDAVAGVRAADGTAERAAR